MDQAIDAAARALAAGDALGALDRVALRDDPPALALRGIAMAQLEDHPRARDLLRRAARGFGAKHALARARCVVAEAEIALEMRELGRPPRLLAAAGATLEARGDRANAVHARLIETRRLLLLGRLEQAAAALAAIDARGAPPVLVAKLALVAAELLLRSLRVDPARKALDRARAAAERARVPALLAEVEAAREALVRPAARCISAGEARTLRLDEVAALHASRSFVVDGCRRGLRIDGTTRSLARRPILFALLRALAEAWPRDAERSALIASAFGFRRLNASHRARLRVEIGRLRALVADRAAIVATDRGFALVPHDGIPVVVLAPPIDGDPASLLALLADGAAWSTSALALAVGRSQRTVQRALSELESAGRVRSIGRSRARRWLAPPLAGFATILLLPAAPPLE